MRALYRVLVVFFAPLIVWFIIPSITAPIILALPETAPISLFSLIALLPHIVVLIFSFFFLRFLWKKWGVKYVVVAGVLGTLVPFVIVASLGLSLFKYNTIPAEERDFPVVSGPESTELLEKSSGSIVYELDDLLVAMSFLDGSQKRVNEYEGVSAVFVSGPDRDGNVVYIGNASDGYHVVLTSLNQEFSPSLVLSRPGTSASVFFDVGGVVALANSGGNFAFTSDVKRKSADWDVGFRERLEIWNVFSKNEVRELLFMDEGIAGFSWFPDGSRLVYGKSVNDEYGIYVYDVETGDENFLVSGINPVISPEGNYMIYQVRAPKLEDSYRIMTLGTGEIIEAQLPGARAPYSGVAHIGMPGDNLVVYFGLPTEGAEPGFTVRNSPLVGPKAFISIKIADVITGEFQTVLDNVDPRESFSYGPSM